MKTAVIVIITIVVGAGLGLGGAFLASQAFSKGQAPAPAQDEVVVPPDNAPGLPYGRGMMGGYGPQGWQGRGSGQYGAVPQGDRISIDDALAKAQAYIANDANLQVTEVMEFSDNFYVMVKEKDTGRGAFELLVDPYTGWVNLEYGPAMMWNLKYGHMGSVSGSADNTITIEQAKGLAQKALDQQGLGVQVENEGTAFYGYYTFDTELNGTINGMLSVNGLTGQVWIHTWHGTFISEKEITQ